jgi:putative cardiolipin synthase
LLLDANNTSGLHGVLAAPDAHPHIEVRHFNPLRFRQWRLLD